MPNIDNVLLRLAFHLQASRSGLTIKELETCIGELKGERAVTRKTVSAYRKALASAFIGRYSETKDEDGYLRIRLAAGAINSLVVVKAEDLAALREAIGLASAAGLRVQAAGLQRLEQILRSLVPDQKKTALTNDLEHLLEIEGYATRQGPRPRIPEELFHQLREAIQQCRVIEIQYESQKDNKLRMHELEPYGLLLGHWHYLVARGTSARKRALHSFRIRNIRSVKVQERIFQRDESFDLNSYARQSFGVFQEDALDVILHFSARRAADVREYFFHDTQRMMDLLHGGIEVRFTASSVKEILWHLFTWETDVEIIAPKELKEAYRVLLEAALERLR